LYLFFPSNKNYGNSLVIPLKKLERKLEVGSEEGTECAPLHTTETGGLSRVEQPTRQRPWPPRRRSCIDGWCRAPIRAELEEATTRDKLRSATRDSSLGRDGFGLDTHEYEFECHYLPHFISNSDTNANIIECEYKMDISNSDLHSNTYSIYSIES
jgi:hypothetical protein